MKKLFLLFLFLAVALSAQDDDDDDEKPAKPGQAKAAAVPPGPAVDTPADKLVAKIDGKDYTAGEIKKLVAGFPPNIRNSFAQNPVRTLNYIFLIRHLAAEAETNKLDEDEEFKMNMAWTRLNSLSQSELNFYRNGYRPTPEEEHAAYDKSSERWDQAKFKVIYVSFVPGIKAAPPAPKSAEDAAKAAVLKSAAAGAADSRSEPEAKARIESVRKQLEAGADFGKLAQQYSDDKSSAAKGGDFGTLARGGPYPDALKKTIFALKPSEVSQPVQQPNGYYLFKLESITKQPFNDVESKIHAELQQSHFNEWIKSLEARFTVSVVDNQYFASKPPR
jgi:hypothetical protein